MNLADRIAARVVREGECLVWPGAKSHGYGQISVNGKPKRVHRIAYELAYGPIPEGLEIDHLCGNRACCLPEHLEAVTHAENLRRSSNIVGVLARRTHCSRGHELTEPDRVCRECRRRPMECHVCGAVLTAVHLQRHRRNLHGID